MRRAVWLAVALLALLAPSAYADTIVVNQGGTLDDADSTNGSGPCETEPDEGNCTLRAAIQTANVNPGKDTITFDLDQILARLKPKSALPAITEAVVIDGWSAPPANREGGRPVVEIDGANVPIPDPGSHGGSIRVMRPYGLDVRAPNSEIRGLAIHGFPERPTRPDGCGLHARAGQLPRPGLARQGHAGDGDRRALRPEHDPGDHRRGDGRDP